MDPRVPTPPPEGSPFENERVEATGSPAEPSDDELLTTFVPPEADEPSESDREDDHPPEEEPRPDRQTPEEPGHDDLIEELLPKRED
jgi:hypothetical protein